jgi:hypothetical protein
MRNDKQQVTIVLPKAHHTALRQLALEKHTSMANLIRQAILKEFEDEEALKGN